MNFDVIDVIFNERLIIGESVDFSYDFCIYIGRKWFELWIGDLVCWMGKSVDFNWV